jgi:hypothetical protein
MLCALSCAVGVSAFARHGPQLCHPSSVVEAGCDQRWRNQEAFPSDVPPRSGEEELEKDGFHDRWQGDTLLLKLHTTANRCLMLLRYKRTMTIKERDT